MTNQDLIGLLANLAVNDANSPASDQMAKMLELVERMDKRLEQMAAEQTVMRQEIVNRPAIKPRLLEVPDAAAYIGRTLDAVKMMVHRRELPAVKHGRRVHLDRQDLDAWIEQGKV
jgi:excisionase family DNA binding protein